MNRDCKHFLIISLYLIRTYLTCPVHGSCKADLRGPTFVDSWRSFMLLVLALYLSCVIFVNLCAIFRKRILVETPNLASQCTCIVYYINFFNAKL